MKKEIVQLAHWIKKHPQIRADVDIAYNPRYKIPENGSYIFEQSRKNIRKFLVEVVELVGGAPYIWDIMMEDI